MLCKLFCGLCFFSHFCYQKFTKKIPAPFRPLLTKFGHTIFPANHFFSWPLLSFLAGNSATWQHCRFEMMEFQYLNLTDSWPLTQVDSKWKSAAKQQKTVFLVTDLQVRANQTPHLTVKRLVGTLDTVLLYVWTYKPMLLSLKQHLFKKLSNININYTNTYDLCLKNFPTITIIWRLPGVQSTGELFKKSNNSIETQ